MTHENLFRTPARRAPLVFAASVVALIVPVAPASAQGTTAAPRFSLELESGAAWGGRNVARIRGDSGTYFNLRPLVGGGPDFYYRITATGETRRGQEVRLVYAPLRVSGTGTPGQNVNFDGRTFAAGVPTKATYQFNSPRATYRWRVKSTERAQLWVGFTGLIRDAEIRLEQPGVAESNSNVGFVPLLHLAGEYRFAPRWRAAFDFDGLAAPQGRAFDVGVRATYDVAPGWYVGAGYRTLEGGADNDRVFNFAWFNFATAAVGYRF